MRLLGLGGALVAIAASCATPTSITVDVYTDVPCTARAPASLVVAKALSELGSSAPSAASMRCDADGHLGNVVISPGGAKNGAIALALMLRPDGQPADTCLDAKSAPGCIVAKRQLRFEPRTETRMRVDLRLSCLGVVCADGETCARGTCIKADLDCGASCDEETLVAQSGISVGGGLDGGAAGDGGAVPIDGAIPETGIPGASAPLSPSGPFAISELSIGLGVDHACVLYPSGEVGCWGANDVGQLGDGTTAPRAAPSLSVAGITNATAIASGDRWSCALLADGRVACWGANDRGQLGDGSTDAFATSPRIVSGLAGMTALAAGDAHACAGRPTATTPDVFCWGANDHGQVGGAGGGSSGPSVRQPTASFIDSGKSDGLVLGAGAGHTCVGAGGKLFCWGDNTAGQLGTGDVLPRPSPSAILLPQSASPLRLALGRTSSCAVGVFGVGNTHALSCWGSNTYGELGTGTLQPKLTPTGLGTISRGTFGDGGPVQFTTYTANTVSVGDFHACQLATPTEIACWGRNDQGQLGPGVSGDKTSQTPVTSLPGVTALSTRGSSTCVVGSFGVRCFGALSATFGATTL